MIPPARAIDRNSNGYEDVWELIYQGAGLPGGGDADGDGYTNLEECRAGTNPHDALSVPWLWLDLAMPGIARVQWDGVAGKQYTVLTATNLTDGGWSNAAVVVPPGGATDAPFAITGGVPTFFNLAISDTDSDADGVSDYEERALGFNAASNRTAHLDQTDLQRFNAGIFGANTVSVSVVDERLSERWPEPGVVVLRRVNGLAPLTLQFALGGSATPGTDYTASATSSIALPAGAREVWVEFYPVADTNDAEGAESIVFTLLPGAGYVRGAATSAVVTLADETAAGPPSAKAAARFLVQAAFGPDQDSPADADDIPENVEQVMAVGFEAWIDDQFARPLGLLQPWVDWAVANASGIGLHGNWKEFSWWSRAMEAPYLRPDEPLPQAGDPLRQRVAFALSEILVASDRPEQLGPEQPGMANYYDLMVRHAFGNYGDLLYDVATHPVMGIYLSHLGNRKADPVDKIYPDENFAREIMQLFSIGLWELNPDGTRQLIDGQPVATYDNGDITELARVFTGLSFGNNADFQLYPRDFTQPMKMWDAEHDLGAKTLLNGFAIPARVASPGNTGTAGMSDVREAVSNLFLHPNVGPFVGKQLIQRLVASNPSTAYVARVSAAFADNGSGVRGDMEAVVKAILLDPEARGPERLEDPAWGKLREPFLRVVNLARAFNAASTSGHYPLDQFVLDHMQDPMNAPSVFNFFLPVHSPPGPITEQGLVAPEFQIINASTAITGPNYFWGAIEGGLHRWGAGNASYNVTLNLTNELAMVAPAAQINDNVPAGPALDPDPLLRRLDLALTGGTLTPREFQIVREAMLRVPTYSWKWHRERLRLAIYLIVCSADYNVLR